MENRFARQFVGREHRLKIRLGGPRRERRVVLRLIRNHRPLELRDRLADPLRRHLGRAKRGLKQRRIEGRRTQLGHHLAERRAHLARTFDRNQRLSLQRLGPLVPERRAADVVVAIRQRHRVPASQLPIDACAESVRIREAVLLPMARSARGAPVVRHPRVVKEHPAQRRPGVRQQIVGRRVVERRHFAVLEVLRQILNRVLHIFKRLRRQARHFRRRGNRGGRMPSASRRKSAR